MKKTAFAFNTWITSALVSLTVAWFAVVFFDTAHHFRFDDFLVFAEAGELARAKRSVYHYVAGGPEAHGFKYSPFAALFYGYALPFDFEAAAWVHFALSLLCWIGIALWAVRKLKRPSWPVLVLTFAAFAFPLRDELKMGQCNGFMMAALLLAMIQLKRPWLAGPAIAFAILLKMYAVLALPWFFFRKEYRVLGWTAAALVVLGAGVPALALGPSLAASEYTRWFEILTSSTGGLVTRFDNASLLSFASKASGDPFASKVFWAFTVLAFVVGAWRLRSRSPARAYAYWGASILPLTPLAWPYWNLMALPAAIFVTQTLSRWPRRFAVAWLLIAMNKVNGTWEELALPLAGCALLAVLLARAAPRAQAGSLTSV